MPSRTKCSSPLSSSSSDESAQAKRTRVVKPKVRTGCITWIRRVKCDEEKPACSRCTSTGRKCDGYGPRPKRPSPSDDEADRNLAGVRLVRKRRVINEEATTGAVSLTGAAPTANPYTTLLRPLMADISGTRTERMYFHRFRDIGEEALGIRHMHSGLFWRQIVPQYCAEVPSVKHAYIAFAAAYMHFHVAAAHRPGVGAAPSEAERFVIEQYSMAMERMSHDCALVHLANGTRMMVDLPEDVADILHNPAKWSQGLDTSHLRVAYMVRLLTRLEVSVGHLAADFEPRLTTQAYESRQHEQVAVRARSVEELQDVVEDFCQDVNAFTWMVRRHRSSSENMYWSDPAHRLQYWTLKQRGNNISVLFSDHYVVHGGCYHRGSREYLAMNVGLLRHRVSALTLDLLPFDAAAVLSPLAEAERIQELVAIAERIQVGEGDVVGGNVSHIDVGVVPTLHVAAKHCRDLVTRERLLNLRRQWPRKESLWDGPVMREVMMY